MRNPLAALALCATLGLSACGGGGGSFKDALTFGAGMNMATFALTGEATTFAVSTSGTYLVEAYLVQTVADIGKERLVASGTLTITP